MTFLSKIKRLFINEWFVFIICAFILYGISYGQIYKNYLNTPPGKYYWGSVEYPIDITGNLSFVQQGYAGHWRAEVRMSTTLPEQKTILKTEYLLMGHLARILRTDPFMIFSISRGLISVFYLFSVFFLIQKIFKTTLERSTGIILSLFGSGIYLTGQQNSLFGAAIDDMYVFSRTTVAVHHYMLGGAMTLLSTYYLAKTLDNPKNIRTLLLATCTGFIACWVFAPDAIMILFSLPIVVILKSIHTYITKKKIIIWQCLAVLFPYSIVTSFPILYLILSRIADSKTTGTASFEQLNPFSSSFTQYILALGLTYILSIIAIPFVIKKGNTLLYLLSSWIVLHPLGEFVFYKYLGVNKIRFFLTPYFIIFGILSVVGFFSLVSLLRVRNRFIQLILAVMLIILCLGSSIEIFKKSYTSLSVCFCIYPGFSYPDSQVMELILWLKENSKESDIVLSDEFTGNLVSAFSGNKVYTSWWFNLLYAINPQPEYSYSIYQMQNFYSGKTGANIADYFLKSNSISYIIFNSYIDANTQLPVLLPYPSLKKVKQSGNYILYKVEL